MGKLGWHGKPDSQDVEEDDGKEKTHFVGVVGWLFWVVALVVLD